MSGQDPNSWLNALFDEPSAGAEGNVGDAITAANEGRPFRDVFTRLLGEMARSFSTEDVDFEKERKIITARNKERAEEFTERIVAFLVRAQPGALTPLAREVCREHRKLFKSLGLELTMLNSMIVKRSSES